ncbi:MAG: UDP-N-acetylmuramoyl-tripeptide--D-alanyl-D-alanine ligase [Deltaproteobacteria bacterium]|nr:UDP-N-acetylmuramoyl-tripeptide--D-alanyl-D-alanine ligase [Deltaproteobacteria bacterium]MBN2844958.1 UDP-N-acetylmuramoyl-tripeptide--D-alanyl-D-alanine ligase [Deltaproteobacteria bacterium]
MKTMKMPAFSTDEILEATGGMLIGGRSGRRIEGLSTDSRAIGKGSCFVPLVGERFDGHDYIADALKKGATAVLCSKERRELAASFPDDISTIIVDDTLKALGDMAHFWRRHFSIPVVAITGSSGKTTTKEMLAAIAGISMNVLKNRGNFNNLIGLPLTLFELNSGHEMAIVEMGTNRRGEIQRLTEIAEPDIGVVTNIGPAHLEGFGSLDSVRDEKGDLLLGLKRSGVAVTNGDDEMSDGLAHKWPGRKITFGMRREAEVRAKDVVMKGQGVMAFNLSIGETSGMVEIKAPGVHNVYNALAAAAASLASGIANDDICRGLNEFRQIPGRMSIHRLRNGAYLVDDAYNANPASLREALLTVEELRGEDESIVVFGDMLELGDTSERLHEEAGEIMAETGVQTVFLRGNFSEAVARGLKRGGVREDHIFFTDSPDEVLHHLRGYLRPPYWLLVKGSRGMKMERFVKAVVAGFGEEDA